MLRSPLLKSVLCLTLSLSTVVAFAERHAGQRQIRAARPIAPAAEPTSYFVPFLSRLFPYSDQSLTKLTAEMSQLESASQDPKLAREIPGLIDKKIARLLATVPPSQLELALERVTAEVNFSFSKTRAYSAEEKRLLVRLQKNIAKSMARRAAGKSMLESPPALTKEELKDWVLGEWVRTMQLSGNPTNADRIEQTRKYLRDAAASRIGLVGKDDDFSAMAVQYAGGKSRYKVLPPSGPGQMALILTR